MSWRACLLASAIFLAGMSGGLFVAHFNQEPIEWYGSSEYWQRRARSAISAKCKECAPAW